MYFYESETALFLFKFMSIKYQILLKYQMLLGMGNSRKIMHSSFANQNEILENITDIITRKCKSIQISNIIYFKREIRIYVSETMLNQKLCLWRIKKDGGRRLHMKD